MKRFFIRQVDWEEARQKLLAVRFEVFVEEQQVPEEMEQDEWDARCLHLLAEDEDGGAIGTARLMPEGRLGRVAVVKKWRRCGVGAALVEQLEQAACQRGMASLILHSQTWTIPFYKSLGFVLAEGCEFFEAGIPHRLMEKNLSPGAGSN
ncbi:MAG: GNAT family N-acetyltransferase [Verrucomicrobiota bacterium]